jgi:Lipocalin-like domain
MYRGNACALASLAVSLGISFPASAQSQSLKQQLVGSWNIVQNCEEFQDGKKNCTPFGANMKGLLMLESGGTFSLQMIGGDRAKTNDPRTPVGPMVAYFGTYSVNESDNTLTYHIERASWPNFEGQDQTRLVAIRGDEMSYQAQAPINSPQGQFVPRLEFKRAK